MIEARVPRIFLLFAAVAYEVRGVRRGVETALDISAMS